MLPSIDIVIRTKADAFRAPLLFRALDSIRAQRRVDARAVVIVNGSDVDEKTVSALEERPGIVVHTERRGSAGLAMVIGRSLVTAPYFAFLDDDDELIPGSLYEPLRWIVTHDACDVVISNGYFVTAHGAKSELIHIADHATLEHPALGLLVDGWLVPGAFICRTTAVDSCSMDERWDNMEWTRLAFELCAEQKHFHFMDVPTLLYHDTNGSASKQVQHQQEAQLALMTQVSRDLRLVAATRRAATRKYARTLHHLAITYRDNGQYFRAWRCHIGSLRWPYTFSYLPVTRKLLLPIHRSPQR